MVLKKCLLNLRCVRCHSNDGYDSEEVWKNDAAKIIDRISVENKGGAQTMPPAYDTTVTPMSDEDREFLVDYMNSL